MECSLIPKYGQIQLNICSVEIPKGKKAKNIILSVNTQKIPAKIKQEKSTVTILLQNRITVKANGILNMILEY